MDPVWVEGEVEASVWSASLGGVGLGRRTYPNTINKASSLSIPQRYPHLTAMDADPPTQTEAVIFDKDGTLVDFHTTWDESLGRTIDKLLGQDDHARSQVASGLGFDLNNRTILPNAPFVAESGYTLNRIVAPFVDPELFEATLISEGEHSARAMDGALEVILELRTRGLKLGVATNDSEGSAIKQLNGLGWHGLFDTVVGYDSGFKAKPNPKMVLGCCSQLGIDPARALMVGDTATDMRAATAAGVTAVAIGTDPAALSLADYRIGKMSDLLGLI